MTTLDKLITPELREQADKAEYKFERRAPGVLLPYQQRWVQDTSQVKISEKSRRIGLTWAEAADDVLTAAASTGMDVWYIGYNKDMAIEFILDCAQWTAHLGEAAGQIEEGEEVYKDGDEQKSILTYSIKYASGNRITALSSRPSNLRGKQGKVVIDEAAFHNDLGELLKAAFALLIWGGRVAIISTHDGADNDFNSLILDVRAGKVPYSVHRTTFDEALADGLYDRVCLKTGKKWSAEGQQQWRDEIYKIYRANAAEELDVIPSQSGGAYMSRAMIEARMDPLVPVLRLTCKEGFEQLPQPEREAFVADWIGEHLQARIDALPKDLRSYYGQDFARNGDLSVLWPLVEQQSLHRITPFLIEMRNVPFKQQEQLVFWVADRLPRFAGGAHDARGNGQYLAEVAMQRYGATMIHQVMLTQQWYRENMPRYKAAFEDGEISIPKDADVLADHRAIVMDKGVPKVPDTGHTTGADGGQRHGDSAIAGALAWFASLNPGSVIEFESIGDDNRIGSGFDDYMRAL
jgi:phage FluMu gp28-like protein